MSKMEFFFDNIHYGPSPVDTSDNTTFNVFFSPILHPKRPLSEFILGTSGISEIQPPLVIQPEKIETLKRHIMFLKIFRLSLLIRICICWEKVLKHAISPNNDTIRIINIPKWDFRWQYFYTFQRILKIPANSVIHVEGIYDNTENNPLNPFHPPQVVSERNGSIRTTDEMFQLIVTWMPYQNGDEMISLELPEK